MVPVADGVYRDVVEILQLLIFLFRDGAHICDIGYVAEAEAQDRQLAVNSTNGDYFNAVATDSPAIPFKQWVVGPFGLVERIPYGNELS